MAATEIAAQPLPIVQIGEPVLRQVAKTLSLEELRSTETQHFINQLISTMRAANGAGLAANQVGTPLQICAVEVQDNPRYPYKPNIPLTVLINPQLEPLDEEVFENYEGCLSVPNLRGLVSRAVHLRVTAWDRDGNTINEVVHGLKAATYQHECDHLQGILFVDRVKDPKSLCTWQAFERYHKKAFVERAKKLVQKHGE